MGTIDHTLREYMMGFIVLFIIFALQIALSPTILVYLGNITTLSSNNALAAVMTTLYWFILIAADVILFLKVLLPKMAGRY